ncbi:protein O-glucosyltransferase 2-like [Oculina patagonica]
MKLYAFWMIMCFGFYFNKAVNLSAKKSLIWGPGLDGKIVLPARHFFIQAVDEEHNNLTTSPGQDAFEVKITSSSGRVRTWVQKLDRHDGSFIVRYRLFASYPELTIQVTHKAKNVAKSPYILQEHPVS